MTNLIVQGCKIDWSCVPADSYLWKINSLREMEKCEFSRSVTFFVGENGSGKSTLLEAIALAYGFNPEGGTLNYRFSTHDSHSELGEHITLMKEPTKRKWGYFLRAESFYNVSSQEEAYFGPSSAGYHRKSHGEAFLSVFKGYCQSRGLYLLDEPESALSPQRQLALLRIIHEGVKVGGQFIIASHSPILMTYPGAEILSFDGGAVQSISYEDSSAYQLTKLVVEHPQEILRHLFKE